MFDFEICHIPRKKHTATDSLSRCSATEAEKEEEAKEGDINDWPDTLLFKGGLLEFGISHMSSQRHNNRASAYSDLICLP